MKYFLCAKFRTNTQMKWNETQLSDNTARGREREREEEREGETRNLEYVSQYVWKTFIFFLLAMQNAATIRVNICERRKQFAKQNRDGKGQTNVNSMAKDDYSFT